jgi:hypothetical protein
VRGCTDLPLRAGVAPLSVSALLVSLLATVVLAACGSSPTQAPASVTPSVQASASPEAAASVAPSGGEAGIDVCALLPTADLSKIMVGPPPVAKAMSRGGWVAGQCAWNGPTSGFFLSVGTAASITAFGDPAAADAKAKLAQFKKNAGGTAKDVAGIGDGAVATASGLAAYKGGTYLLITNLGLTEDQLVEIAKLAVAKL